MARGRKGAARTVHSTRACVYATRIPKTSPERTCPLAYTCTHEGVKRLRRPRVVSSDRPGGRPLVDAHYLTTTFTVTVLVAASWFASPAAVTATLSL